MLPTINVKKLSSFGRGQIMVSEPLGVAKTLLPSPPDPPMLLTLKLIVVILLIKLIANMCIIQYASKPCWMNRSPGGYQTQSQRNIISAAATWRPNGWLTFLLASAFRRCHRQSTCLWRHLNLLPTTITDEWNVCGVRSETIDLRAVAIAPLGRTEEMCTSQ